MDACYPMPMMFDTAVECDIWLDYQDGRTVIEHSHVFIDRCGEFHRPSRVDVSEGQQRECCLLGWVDEITRDQGEEERLRVRG